MKVNVFTCPWVKRYIGAASQVGVAIAVEGHKVELVGTEMTVDGKSVPKSQDLSGGGTAKMITEGEWSGFLITSGGTSFKAMVADQYHSEDIPPGYIYNTMVHAPKDEASGSSGLCKGLSGVSRVKGAMTMFTAGALSDLNDMCFKKTGMSLESFKPVSTAEDACKANKHSMDDAEKTCADVPEMARKDCIYDFCSQGSALAAEVAKQGAAMYAAEVKKVAEAELEGSEEGAEESAEASAMGEKTQDAGDACKCDSKPAGPWGLFR